jgi:hypothetical protein
MFGYVLKWLPPGVELLSDVTPADWVMQRLKPWDPGGARLKSFAPDGFEAYARVFHPAGGLRPAMPGVLDPSVGTTWSDLGRARGIVLTPDISFLEVSGIELGDDHALDMLAPMSGEIPPETCDALAAVLRRHTATPDPGWFCLWEGNGSFWSGSHGPLLPPDARREEIERNRADAEAQDRLLAATPRVEAYARRYFLFRGPLDAACSFEPGGSYTSPNLWWPDDRAWIVVTEVDGYSTYVGATSTAIEDVVASPDIEAIDVGLDTHMDPEGYPPQWR